MTRRDRIAEALRQTFQPIHLEVIDESYMHSVPKGAESHYKVVVVADAFTGKNAVLRHQAVYGALRAELDSGMHAVAITSRDPAEWASRPEALVSPACAGGSKAERG